MCGRMLSTSSASELVDYFDVDVAPQLDLRPDYNVAPTRDVAIVRDASDGRHLDMAHWGLVPGWAKDPSGSSRLINARAETVATKPSFRSAFKRKRCLVPADGFYEWQAVEGRRTKQPYLVTMADGTPLSFAGLWETWHAPDGETLRSCTIITCPANATMTMIHHRMPVILPKGAWDSWLDPDRRDAHVAAGEHRGEQRPQQRTRVAGRSRLRRVARHLISSSSQRPLSEKC